MKAPKRMFLIVCGIVIVPMAVFAQTTQTTGEPEPLRGTITGGEVRCYLGVTQPTDPQALKEGEVCQKTSVKCEGVEINKPVDPNTPVGAIRRLVAAAISAVTLAQGEVGYVTSVCKSGKCVAKFACDGKEFPGLPQVPPATGGATPVTDPPPTIPSVPNSPSIPSVPASSNPQAPSVPPSTNPSPTPNIPSARPVSPTPLPATNPPTQSPGSTFNPPSASPFQLGAGGSGNIQYGNGQYPGGVFSGGNPFYSGSTFGGAANWGANGSFSSNGMVTNLFSSFVSNVIGNLFSGFGGNFNGGVVTTRPPAPTPTPSLPTPQPSVVVMPPQSPPQQVADSGKLDAMYEAYRRGETPSLSPFMFPNPLPRNFNGFPDRTQLPTQSDDRTGLPQPGSTQQPLTGEPSRIPAEVIEVPKPNDTPVIPPKPNESDIVTVPQPITREVAQATFNQAQANLEDRTSYDKFLDWLGIGSPEGNAYQGAVRDLESVAMKESLQKLAAEVRSIPTGAQVAEGGPVITDAEPIDVKAVEESLTLEERAKFEAEWAKFEQEFNAAPDDGARTEIFNKKMEEIRRIAPEIDKALGTFNAEFQTPIVPPEPEPALSPSRMLEGLSKIGERVRDAAEEAARTVFRTFSQVSENPPQVTVPPSTMIIPPAGSAQQPGSVTTTPLPQEPETPAPVPTPVPAPVPSEPTPTPAPQNPPTAGRSNGFVQGSISLLSALVQGLVGFFTNDDSGDTPRPTPPAPAPSMISATITANPSTIDDGDTTQLAWSSVGAESCIVVDALLNEMRRGTAGTTTTQALNASTRFGVICDIANGTDKFVNEVLVRVSGDDNEPVPLFSHSGRVSQSLRTGATTTNGSIDVSGEAGAPTPIDVRTCEPDQSIDTFIKCLCEAEPNPNGCSLVPRN